MVISKTTTAHREYRWTREEAKKQGITLINFVDHFPKDTQLYRLMTTKLEETKHKEEAA